MELVKKMTIIIPLIVLPLLLVGSINILAEEYIYEPTIINGYYYLDELEIYGIILENPTVCALEIEDHLMPEGSEEQLMQLAETSVAKWQSALEDTGGSWNMDFKTIPLNKQYLVDEIDEECEIIIYFIREENEELWESNGFENYDSYAITDTFGPVADLWIIYREMTYSEYDEPYYINYLDPYLDETISHELGHAFSLDHKLPTIFVEEDGVMYSDTIMGDPSEIPESFLGEVVFEITEFDVQAMIQLYGKNGFESDGELGFPDTLFKEPTLMEKTLKQNIEKFPEHFPISYLLLLESLGLII